jgi:hypothetical protein
MPYTEDYITLILDQITFSLSLYVQVRAVPGSTFQNWALTCVFVGGPLGSILAGLIIKKTKEFKALLFGTMILGTLPYFCLGLGWISKQPRYSSIHSANYCWQNLNYQPSFLSWPYSALQLVPRRAA